MVIRQKGFSIVEVMIAVMVASVGMLGVAAGQANNMRYTNNSFDYTMAVLEANNAIEQVWQHQCRLQDNPASFDTIKPGVQNTGFTISYPDGFVVNNFRVVVEWSDERLIKNLANRVEITISFPDIRGRCTS